MYTYAFDLNRVLIYQKPWHVDVHVWHFPHKIKWYGVSYLAFAFISLLFSERQLLGVLNMRFRIFLGLNFWSFKTAFNSFRLNYPNANDLLIPLATIFFVL